MNCSLSGRFFNEKINKLNEADAVFVKISILLLDNMPSTLNKTRTFRIVVLLFYASYF